MKKILICGVTGFIGRNMAEHFVKDDEYQVYGVYYGKEPWDCPNITFIKADLREEHQVGQVVQGMDIIIQAAATTSGSKDIISRPYIHVTDNAVMNSLIFRAASESNVKHVIFFSCGVMYQPGRLPRKEQDFKADDEMVPQYFGVGWTKVYIEKMCEFYSRVSETKYTVLRQSNIYGPYDKYDYEHSHMFGATIRKVADTEDGGGIVIWGDGKETRDLLYVEDVVDFVDRAIKGQKEKFQLCNVGYGMAYSVNDVVRKIIEASGKDITVSHDIAKPSIPTHLCFDIEKANKLFGWRPKVSLEKKKKKTLQWYQDSRRI